MNLEIQGIIKSHKEQTSDSEDFKDISFESIDMSTKDNQTTLLKNIILEVLASCNLNRFCLNLLEQHHQNFLFDLLKKKYMISEDFKLLGIKKLRRNEERFKYVTKRGFKNLYKKYKQRNCFYGFKKLDNLEFYQYYFEQISIEQDIPLEKFYLPGSILQKYSQTNQKLDTTVSIQYFNRIMSSQLFKKDFIKYLIEEYFQESQAIKIEKVDKIIQRFEQDKIKGLRLPWSDKEVYDSQSVILNYIITNFN